LLLVTLAILPFARAIAWVGVDQRGTVCTV
jgi:hypothetical protein